MITTGQPHSTPLAEAARLMRSFDVARLKNELAEVAGYRWQPQRIHDAGGVGESAAIDWRVLPLRSPGGDGDRTDPGGPGPVDFAPTRWLNRLPYLREILNGIPAPLNAVRLMALGPGAVSTPHRDPKYALHRGLMRLHIPIVTQPGAVLVLDGVEHCWQPGEFWYGDFSREHLVRNTGPTTRVHAVVDALLTHELSKLFPSDWQGAFSDADVLFNRPTIEADLGPTALTRTADIPEGFTDFGDEQSLDGPLQPTTISLTAQRPMLTTEERVFALVWVGPAEYRFAGWSEQRTLQLTDDVVVLRVRHGRTLAERTLPATATQ